MRPLSIGILGGVGAIASARFHLDLVQRWAQVRNAKTDEDFPLIRHISRSLGLGSEGVVDRELTKRFALWAVCDFDDCHYVAVVCNSITPLLVPHETLLTPVAACAERLKGVKEAWLLASESTIHDRIYHDAYPHVNWHSVPITAQIQQAISGRTVSLNQLDIPPGVTIVLGCTELSTDHPTTDTIISPTYEMIEQLCRL